jgi:hypothetical protein
MPCQTARASCSSTQKYINIGIPQPQQFHACMLCNNAKLSAKQIAMAKVSYQQLNISTVQSNSANSKLMVF